MAYQYPPPPPPPHSDPDVRMAPSGYMPDYQLPSTAPPGLDMRLMPGPILASADRRSSLPNAMNIKRSMSTPDVRPLQLQPSADPAIGQDQHQLAMVGEKRRNKLGYHRTSVACGHCRRRKIRCIPSPTDGQGRCVNCIRLKKECSFFPIEQQLSQDPKHKLATRPSVTPKATSASSSPGMTTGLPPNIHGPQQPYQQLAMPSIQSMAPTLKSPGTEFPSDGKGPPPAARSFEYGHASMASWLPPDAAHGSSKASELGGAWRPYQADPPVTPAFSSYTSSQAPLEQTWAPLAAAESAPRAEMSWSSYSAQSPRSLSLGSESMAAQHQHYEPMPQAGCRPSRPYEPKPGAASAAMYPGPIATTAAGGIEAVSIGSMDQHVPLSAGAGPPPGYETWQQPYHYPKSGGEHYGGWYGEHMAHPPLGSAEQAAPQPPPGQGIYFAER